jgi:hypothetical protein
MSINFNPRLTPDDALTPGEIEAKIAARNEETRRLTEQAYLTGGVPVSAAEKAASHSSIQRQTAEAKKARRDAKTWWKAKFWSDEEDDE